MALTAEQLAELKKNGYYKDPVSGREVIPLNASGVGAEGYGDAKTVFGAGEYASGKYKAGTQYDVLDVSGKATGAKGVYGAGGGLGKEFLGYLATLAAVYAGGTLLAGAGGASGGAGYGIVGGATEPAASLAVGGAGTAAPVAATGAGAATAGGGGSSLAGTVAKLVSNQLAGGIASAVLTSVLSPKAESQVPEVTAPTLMPDPAGQQQDRRKSIVEQLSRRGRASTILTDTATGGKLGG